MALRRYNMGGRSPMKRKEDVIAMREIADRRKRRQEQIEQQRRGEGAWTGQEKQNEARWLEQERCGGSPLPAWANDAIRKSQG